MSLHTMTAEIPVQFSFPGLAEGERETAYVKVELTYAFTAGAPEVRYQNNGDPGWPADPDEVELRTVTLIDGDGLEPSAKELAEWASDWLDYKGYEQACENAREQDVPDPDLLYEQRRDDAMMDRLYPPPGGSDED